MHIAFAASERDAVLAFFDSAVARSSVELLFVGP